MPSFPVNITLRLNGAQFNQMLTQIGTSAKNARVQIGQLQGSAANMDKSVMRGAGSFFLMHRAMSASIGVMKRGIQGAIDFDYALSRLQWAIHGNATQMKVFERIAQETAIQLGPIGATEVIQGMERLARVTQLTQRGMAQLAPDVARVVSNIVELSDKAVSVPQMFTSVQQMLSAFEVGGDLEKSRRVLLAMHGTIQAFAAEDPERLIKGTLAAIPTMKGLGMSPEDIFAIAGMRKLIPTRGRATSGIDLSQLARVFFGAYVGDTGKMAEKRRGAMGELGLMTPGGKPLAGEIGMMGTLLKMGSVIQAQQAKLDPKAFQQWLLGTFKRAFNTQLVGDLGLALGQNQATVIEVLDKLTRVLDPDKLSKLILGTSRGTIGQFLESIDTLLTNLNRKPLAGVTPFIQKGSDWVQQITRNVGAGGISGGAALAAAMGIPMGLMGAVGGQWMKSIGAKGLGAAVGAGGTGLLIAGIIGATLTAGIVAYQNSDEFSFVVDKFRELLGNMFGKGFFGNLYDLVKSNLDELASRMNESEFFGASLRNRQMIMGPPEPGMFESPEFMAHKLRRWKKGKHDERREKRRQAKELLGLSNTGAANPTTGPGMSPGVRTAVTSRHMEDARAKELARQLFSEKQRGTHTEIMSRAIR